MTRANLCMKISEYPPGVLGTCMVHQSCTYQNVTSTVTHFMEFTEEFLSVFWTYVHALLCVYFWLLGTWAKITRSRWSYIQTHTFSKWHLTKRAGNMCHNLNVSWYDTAFLRLFSYLTLPILKTIINLQKCSVQSCHHRHKGSYTGELHFVLLQTYLTRSREDFDACGMVVHSELYIPVSSSIYHSLLDLVIISPFLVLTLTHEPWYAAFKMCWYKATFVRAVISSNKPFW